MLHGAIARKLVLKEELWALTACVRVAATSCESHSVAVGLPRRNSPVPGVSGEGIMGVEDASGAHAMHDNVIPALVTPLLSQEVGCQNKNTATWSG